MKVGHLYRVAPGMNTPISSAPIPLPGNTFLLDSGELLTYIGVVKGSVSEGYVVLRFLYKDSIVYGSGMLSDDGMTVDYAWSEEIEEV